MYTWDRGIDDSGHMIIVRHVYSKRYFLSVKQSYFIVYKCVCVCVCVCVWVCVCVGVLSEFSLQEIIGTNILEAKQFADYFALEP